jgi:hypothetical protein
MSPIEEVDLGTCGQIFGFDGIRDSYMRDDRLFYASCPMTRKDFAVGHCRRMVLDSAIDLAGAFLHRLGKSQSISLPLIAFDHIVEWIFTTECLGESSQPQKALVCRIAASIRYQGSAVDATRVVIHLSDRNRARIDTTWGFHDGTKPHVTHRREVQYEFYNVSIGTRAPYDVLEKLLIGYGPLCARIHFSPKQCAGGIIALAYWIFRVFDRDLNTYLKHPRSAPRYETIKLYDVPTLLVQSSKTLADVIEAGESIRDCLLRHITSYIRLRLDPEKGDNKSVVKNLLDAIEFPTTKNPDAAIQYPWWRPVPVSPFTHSSFYPLPSTDRPLVPENIVQHR